MVRSIVGGRQGARVRRFCEQSCLPFHHFGIWTAPLLGGAVLRFVWNAEAFDGEMLGWGATAGRAERERELLCTRFHYFKPMVYLLPPSAFPSGQREG